MDTAVSGREAQKPLRKRMRQYQRVTSILSGLSARCFARWPALCTRPRGVAQRLTDRSHDLIGLANDALSRKPALPAGPALVEPLNDDRRDHADHPAQKIRHPRNVRILPPSRDFH